MSITRERAATWFATTHPPGPAAREMYRMAAEALRAQVVVDDSLAPRSAFPDVDGYIKYLIGVILNLQVVREHLRALVSELEEGNGSV